MARQSNVPEYYSTKALGISGINAPNNNPPLKTSGHATQLLLKFSFQVAEVHTSSHCCTGVFQATANGFELRGSHYDGPTNFLPMYVFQIS